VKHGIRRVVAVVARVARRAWAAERTAVAARAADEAPGPAEADEAMAEALTPGPGEL